MKNSKKFNFGLLSGIIIGIVGGALLTQNQREDIRRSLSYKTKKLFLNIISFF